MGDFRLIAIRPLKGCSPKFRKVLKDNKVYKFYNDFEFLHINNDEKKDVISIKYKSSIPDDLYSFKKAKGDPLSINISAIVGKNGSGKSTLIELFFVAVYNIAVDKGILKEIENKEGVLEPIKKESGIFVEIYYCLNKNIYCLKINGQKETDIKIVEFKDKKSKREFIINKVCDDYTELLKNSFFYSIACNYSFYGLNSELIGNWIKALFHKNDGYQTPVVINPYRDEGNIEINTEIYLAKQRLLSNILKPGADKNNLHRKLTEYQKVTHITFKINKGKIDCAFRKGPTEKDIVSFDDFYKNVKKEVLFNEIHQVFTNSKKPAGAVKYKVEVENYIIKKLIRIASTYKDYKDYFTDAFITHYGVKNPSPNDTIQYFKSIKHFKNYLTALYGDKSHITFKLRQAINYLMNDPLHDDIGDKSIRWKSFEKDGTLIERFKISIEELSERILNFSKKGKEIVELIPPSLFDIEIHLMGKDIKESLFSELSSGEQQLIHSVQGILYNINNVNSVFNDDSNGKNKIKYRYINVLLDEIELYFHPDYQRKFISYLFESLKSMNLQHIEGINILFLTHSPFILSDIPAANILMLEEGIPAPFDRDEQTFSANINELLANNFLPKDAPIGEYAKKTLESLVEYLKNARPEFNGWNKGKAEGIINIIADDIIRMRLNDLFKEKFAVPMQSLYDEKKALEKRLFQINKRLGNDTN